jgi:hypothetical protein
VNQIRIGPAADYTRWHKVNKARFPLRSVMELLTQIPLNRFRLMAQMHASQVRGFLEWLD